MGDVIGLADLVRSQRGVVTRRQLYDIGVSRRTVSRRVAEGLWVPHGRDVLTICSTPDTLDSRSRIAALRVPGSILTGPSAASLLGRGPWEAVALGRQPWLFAARRHLAGVRFLTHPGARSRVVAGLRVAVIDVVVTDLLRILPLPRAKDIAYRAVQTRAVSLAVLLAGSDRLSRCAGAEQLRSIIRELSTGTHSDSERIMVKLLRQSGLTGWRPNHRIVLRDRVVEGDIVFEDHTLVVEVDGRAWHTDHERFQTDRTRQNALVGAGWTVLRFTWEDLTQRPGQVIAAITESLR
jgi:very-short-patch-repair endonuclease